MTDKDRVYWASWHIVHLLHVIAGSAVAMSPCQGWSHPHAATQCRDLLPLTPSNAALQHSPPIGGWGDQRRFHLVFVNFHCVWHWVRYDSMLWRQYRYSGEFTGWRHGGLPLSPLTPADVTNPPGAPASRSHAVFLADSKHVRWRRDETRDSLRDMSRESSQFPPCCHTVHFLSWGLYELICLSWTACRKVYSYPVALAPQLETIRFRGNSTKNLIWWNLVMCCFYVELNLILR